MWSDLIPFSGIFPKPPWDVHPILPVEAFRAAYLAGLKDGVMLTALALTVLYLLLKEFWK